MKLIKTEHKRGFDRDCIGCKSEMNLSGGEAWQSQYSCMNCNNKTIVNHCDYQACEGNGSDEILHFESVGTFVKRYFLFSGDDYYPGGGMIDFLAQFETLTELKMSSEFKEVLKRKSRWNDSWVQIWDMKEMKELKEIHV